MQQFITEMMTKVVGSLMHNWLPLSLAILTAAIMKVVVDPEKLKQALLRKTHISIWASVIVGALTPLCACGTMAVILGMLTTTLPWGPIMAFLTSSPLMSPDGFIMLAGIINFKLALALTIASIIIGLGSGYVTHWIEKNTDLLKNQTRIPKKQPIQSCTCSDPVPHTKLACCDLKLCCVGLTNSNLSVPIWTSAYCYLPVTAIDPDIFLRFLKRIKWREIADALLNIGVKQILFFYSVFVAVGFLVNHFVPTSIIVSLFSAQKLYAVPLAALIGFPIYVSGESSIPLIQALMTGGASPGSMLAFLVTGPGTSAWVIAGIATFMKKRVIGLYIFFLLAGGIVLGYLYDLLLAIGI